MGSEQRGWRDDESLSSIASINVTPFVDVVLVLLVIFMVTAPMMMKESLRIRLPRTTTSDGASLDNLGIAITAQGNILLNGELADEYTLRERAKAALKTNPQAQAIISADKETRHGDVVKVMDWLKSSGFERFAMQIEISKGN